MMVSLLHGVGGVKYDIDVLFKASAITLGLPIIVVNHRAVKFGELTVPGTGVNF